VTIPAVVMEAVQLAEDIVNAAQISLESFSKLNRGKRFQNVAFAFELFIFHLVMRVKRTKRTAWAVQCRPHRFFQGNTPRQFPSQKPTRQY